MSYEDVASKHVQQVASCDFLLPRNLIKTCVCVHVCVYQNACSWPPAVSNYVSLCVCIFVSERL